MLYVGGMYKIDFVAVTCGKIVFLLTFGSVSCSNKSMCFLRCDLNYFMFDNLVSSSSFWMKVNY